MVTRVTTLPNTSAICRAADKFAEAKGRGAIVPIGTKELHNAQPRNKQCNCGSGLKYKHCCGRVITNDICPHCGEDRVDGMCNRCGNV